MENNGNRETEKRGLWRIIDSIEGDKVIWIIVLLLILISVLAIFSSTSLLSDENRIDIMKDHCMLALGGLVMIFVMYKWIPWIGLYRVLSKYGFLLSFALLFILDFKLNLGFIRSETINKATRTLNVAGLQIHVFEIVKVTMVMYLAWALHAHKQDCEAMEAGEESPTFGYANRMARSRNFSFMKNPFWKRVMYIYLPTLTVCGMVAMGSGSSAAIIALILFATMLIGGIPFKELLLPVSALAVIVLLMIGAYKLSGDKFMKRTIETVESRLTIDYDTKKLKEYRVGSAEFYSELDKIRQPYGAQVAIYEGGIKGKGSGNSTQKYSVTHIYSDYMFSFLIEEYGLLGGILLVILYVSLIARCSMTARLCGNEFAKIAIGGLGMLITGQAVLHMLVNVGIGPMTGQTLPLISDGTSAFLVFCFAFGIILSISRMTKNKIKSIEESASLMSDDIQERISILEGIDDENINLQ